MAVPTPPDSAPCPNSSIFCFCEAEGELDRVEVVLMYGGGVLRLIQERREGPAIIAWHANGCFALLVLFLCGVHRYL